MALYLGDYKCKINLGGIVYRLNIPTISSEEIIVGLLSSDNYILQDSNGVYLIPKDGE